MCILSDEPQNGETLKTKIMEALNLNKQLGNLVSQNINLDFFFTTSIDNNGITCIGFYNLIAEEYLLSIGFELYNYAYASDDDTKQEYKRGNIRVVLSVK